MGLSSVRVDTGGGGCVQTKMRFFTIFGGESRRVRGEIAGVILPAVKSCRGDTDRDLRFWIYDLPAGADAVGGREFRLVASWKENGNNACGGGRDLLAWVG